MVDKSDDDKEEGVVEWTEVERTWVESDVT